MTVTNLWPGNPVDFGCPSWCTRTDHGADELQTGDTATHYGPDFGQVSVQLTF